MTLGENDLPGICLQGFDHCIKHDNFPPNFGPWPIFLRLHYTSTFPGTQLFSGSFLTTALFRRKKEFSFFATIFKFLHRGFKTRFLPKNGLKKHPGFGMIEA
jgi:hypothetical protein